MTRNPRQEILYLYARAIQEALTPAEQHLVSVDFVRNSATLQGPDHLKKKVDEAFRRLTDMRPSA